VRFPKGIPRAGFLFSRYGFNFRASKARKNKQREKTRAGLAGLIAVGGGESRKSWLESA
jgi:hypothetical protein